MAVLEGMKISHQNEVQYLTIFFDCLSLISILQQKERCVVDCATIIWDIEQLSSSFKQINFYHVNRDLNVFAHKLARAGLYSIPCVWYSNYPNWMVTLAHSEQHLFVSPRGVHSL